MSNSPKKNSSKKEVLILSITLVVTISLFAGCLWWIGQKFGFFSTFNQQTGTVKSGDTSKKTKLDLRILGDTFSGYSTLRNQAFKDAIIAKGITIQYQDEFDQKARAEAIAAGKADVIVTTLDQFLTHQPQGKIVALIDRTIGADAIVINSIYYPQIKSLLDIDTLVKNQASQGKKLKIIYAKDTPSEFLSLVLDIKFDGFNLSDFDLLEVEDASIAWEKMQQDKSIILGVLWEPFVTEAQQLGNLVLLSSKDAPRVIIDVMVASDRLLNNNPQAMENLVETYYRHIDASVQNQTILTRQIALDSGLGDTQAKTIIKGIHFFTSLEAQEWINTGQLEKQINSIGAILALSNRASVPSNPKNLYTEAYLAPVAQQTLALLELVEEDNPELAARLKGKTPPLTTTPKPTQQVRDIGNLTVRGEVKFQTGLAQLTPEGKQTLDKLAQEIREFSPETVGIKVQGHTSRSGNAAFNQSLSLQRAQIVANYLKSKQLPHNFSAEGLGFSQPLPGIAPESIANQRTVIRLVRLNS